MFAVVVFKAGELFGNPSQASLHRSQRTGEPFGAPSQELAKQNFLPHALFHWKIGAQDSTPA